MENRVLEAFIKHKIECQKTEIQEAIKEQERLSKIMRKKKELFDELMDQSISYLKVGTEKFYEKFPQYKDDLPNEDIKIDIAKHALSLAVNNPSQFAEITKHMKEIEELNKNDEITKPLTKAFFEYAMAFSEFEERLKKDRKHLFSKEYKERMESLADDGVLMYFLETPDYPLTDPNITSKDIMDCLIEEGIDKLLSSFFQMENVGISMQRKLRDLAVTLFLLDHEEYRCASRNIFALLDSEHKKAADAYEGIIAKKRKYIKANQRAKKVDSLVDAMEDAWLKKAWGKIDQYYAKVWNSNPVEGVTHRNTIVHGDYDNQLIEVDKYSAYKLLLLWINLRLIADNFCLKAEILENIIGYLPAIISHLNNQEEKTSN